MDSYIIRIYRRDEEDPRNVIGLVEIAERDERQPFHNPEELLTILGNASAGRKKRKKAE